MKEIIGRGSYTWSIDEKLPETNRISMANWGNDMIVKGELERMDNSGRNPHKRRRIKEEQCHKQETSCAQ